ncbi:MAG TPA: hypothetical protein P5293_04895 [Bacteroidales bacterium]|nr:hypothetical protein [Bacteroidales bacterium]
MDSYGFNNQGPFYVQREATLPAWSASDEGRLIYDESADSLYYGTSTDWVLVSISSGIVSGVKMYFYQNTAPVGWTIDVSVADALIGVKGGTSSFNVAGGNLAGTWTQPGHTHMTADHTHSVVIPGDSGWPHSNIYGYGQLAVGRGHAEYVDYMTSNRTLTSGSATGGSTTSSGTTNTYRPYAAIGIICTKS